MQNNFSKGYYSTDRAEGAIWHEIGHYYHEKYNPQIYNAYKVKGFLSDGDELIAALVSKYATKSADEFVAEVFAAHIAGMDLNYPLDVFVMFQKYGGAF
jgi:hypothetical protein